MTLTEMLKQNGHLNETNMILKIDCEGAEWEAYNDLSEEFLSKFKYIVGEFHWFKKNMKNPKKAELIIIVFKKLNKTHQVFYKHYHNSVETFALYLILEEKDMNLKMIIVSTQLMG